MVLREEVYFLLPHCNICIRNASNHSKGPLTSIVSTSLWERIQLDLINFQHEPDEGYKWVLHIRDHFSKFSQLYALPDKSSAYVADSLA